MASPTEITVSQLSRLLGTHECPQLIDVRIDEDYNDDPRHIPGAVRHPFNDMSALAERFPGKAFIVYCQKGLKISQGAAAILRNLGRVAETLEGGHFAWAGAGQPFIDGRKIPPQDHEGRTLWVTRPRPKVDRVACPWLIRRFIDPSARFLFVSPSEVMNVAERFDATPFDMEGTFWSHRGEQCTFDTILSEFGLETEALGRLAVVVRGADTDRHELAPESAGMLAALLGLSRMYRDDLDQLDAAFPIMDAFYRWARDATDEKHDWPNPNSGSITGGSNGGRA